MSKEHRDLARLNAGGTAVVEVTIRRKLDFNDPNDLYAAMCSNCLHTWFWLPKTNDEVFLSCSNMTDGEGKQALLLQCQNCKAMYIIPKREVIDVEEVSDERLLEQEQSGKDEVP